MLDFLLPIGLLTFVVMIMIALTLGRGRELSGSCGGAGPDGRCGKCGKACDRAKDFGASSAAAETTSRAES